MQKMQVRVGQAQKEGHLIEHDQQGMADRRKGCSFDHRLLADQNLHQVACSAQHESIAFELIVPAHSQQQTLTVLSLHSGFLP